MSQNMISQEEIKTDQESIIEIIETDIKSIKKEYKLNIHIGEMKGFRPVYQLSKLILSIKFNNQTVITTDPFDGTDLVDFNCDFEMKIDLDDIRSTNKFLSNPLIFKLCETEHHVGDSTITISSFGHAGKAVWKSEESILELEEALLGEKTKLHDDADTVSKKSSKKSSSKGSKTKKSNRSSTSSKEKSKDKGKEKTKNKTAEEVAKPKPEGEQVAGTATLDFVPLFLGMKSIEETLILKAPAGQPLDDRMVPAARLPRLNVRVTLDNAIPSGNVFHLTVESIFNPPKVFSEKMAIKLAFGMPSIKQEPTIVFSDYKFSNAPKEKFTFKNFYGTEAPSTYLLSDNYEDVKCNFSDKLNELVRFLPRIDYNVLKRQFATGETLERIKFQIQRYRKIGFELYISNAELKSATKINASTSDNATLQSLERKDKDSKKGKDKSSKVGKRRSKEKDSVTTKGSEKKDEEYLHLMGLVEVCRLIYPGQKSARAACQLRTFNLKEFEEQTGLSDSYFRPKPPPTVDAATESPKEKKKETKEPKKGSNESNSEKKSKLKNDKSKTGNKVGNLNEKLPTQQEAIPASQLIYNEDGLPTFIIVEMEFQDPLISANKLNDLGEELEELVKKFPKGPELPHDFKSKYVTQGLYTKTLKAIIKDIQFEFAQYVDAKGSKENVQEFLKYLKRKGNYQQYTASMSKACTQYCNMSQGYEPEFDSNQYQSFINESYVSLVEEMNSTLCQIFNAGTEAGGKVHITHDGNDLLHYALEATEIGAFGLANRYYLQRICSDQGNAQFWFDYAVYKMHIDDLEGAQECVQEALRRDVQHPDGLVLFACLIARKKKVSEAETCLLNVTLNNPNWLEGWLALYCIYERRKNYEGMEICMEFAQKNLQLHEKRKDDMAWGTDFLPTTVNYLGAPYFIHLGLYDEAEMLMANEVIRKQDDSNEYVLAAIDYYKRHYDHGLLHVKISCSLGSCIPEKNGLQGHFFAQKGLPECALKEYSDILQNDSLHQEPYAYLVFIKAGLCYSSIGDHQKARQCLLQACNLKGTPYTWLCVGVLYYHQKDFLSAEECLTISNTLDNVMPETWAYLTLVNIALKRGDVASSCYQKMLDNKLQNQELLVKVKEKMSNFEYDPKRVSLIAN